MNHEHPAEMYQYLPWPFPDGRFPAHLGAVIQSSVLSGERPARFVVHHQDGDWFVLDGETDHEAPGACVATHVSHAVEYNSSLQQLADLPPGWMAERVDPGHPWERSPHDEADEDD